MPFATEKLLAALFCSALLAACGGSNNSTAAPTATPSPSPGPTASPTASPTAAPTASPTGSPSPTPPLSTGLTPNPFTFSNQTDVATDTLVTSNAVTISGITAPSPVTVTDGGYSIGCTATFVSTAGEISNNQTVCVRHTSAEDPSATISTTLTVGGVSATFSSTTAAAVVAATGRALPFMTGTGDLRLLDPEADLALPDTNPRTVDTGLTPPDPVNCTADLLVNDCFGKAKTFYAATVTGTAVSNLHAARIAYIRNAEVYRVDLTQDLDSSLVLPRQISSIDDACRFVASETTDIGSIDNSLLIVERPGLDGLCGERDQFPADPALDDNTVTVIRLNAAATEDGIDLPLALAAQNPLHAQTNASGGVTGFVSFEGRGADARLVRRDVNLANPTTLQELGQTGGASIHRADLNHLFVTATPDDDGLTLFRVENDGSLSPSLHFFGFVSGNLIRDGLHDATHLYFAHDNRLLRIPLDSASAVAQPATVLTEMDPSLRIIGNWAVDTGATPNRVVFEARDDARTVMSGVFSVPTTASGAIATTLVNSPDSEGGSATLLHAGNGRAYINATHHGAPGEDAVQINTDGTGEVIIAGQPDGSGAYWAGSNRATSLNRATDFAVPPQAIFLARHGTDLNDTLSVFDPATGLEGVALGTVESPGDFQAVKIMGLGRHALARVEIDRFGNRDSDVYAIDSQTTNSLTPLAETEGATDIPIGN